MAVLRNRIYYRVKPFVPQPLRTAIRRRFALLLRERVRETWPIMPGSERPPAGWAGWPKGNKFTLVLTHDVEGQAGLAKCRALMELEREMGFSSSFNFIPEGGYTVPLALREELTQSGFEVGVHDLEHDGGLYRSRAEFDRKARRINQHLRDWGATGFRSGFMLHNLNWLHELDIQYDMSTFDTDPFEPQPEGRGTIFPFFVRRPAGAQNAIPHASSAGYFELPYTLPQDSTLFLLLREATPEIWMRKLDWIAQHGGMALVNVHPDYVRFEGEKESNRTYPVSHYRQFLQYVRDAYGGQFWQPLPRELTGYLAGLATVPEAPTTKRVCMVTHSFYESDNRVTRYASALAARGDTVEVFALRRSAELPAEETIDGVKLFRIQDRFGKTERTRLAYLWPLLRFLRISARAVTRRHSAAPYDLLHVHNVPDFMVFAAWYPRLTGARVILDVHDIVPEFYASKFGMKGKAFTLTLLRLMERVSAAFAHHVIIANDLWRAKYAARTRTTDRCTTFINHVDASIFTPQPRKRVDGKQIILFPGGLQWHQGVDIALRAFAKIRNELPDCEFHIYGDGNARESLIKLASTLQLNGSVKFFQPTTVREIAAVMAEADLGVVPKRADSFGNEAYSTKIMEFMSVGVPVIVSSTQVDRFYFNESIVRFFPSGDSDALAQQMLELLRDASLRQEITARASKYAAANCWETRKDEYLALVDSLCDSQPWAVPVPSIQKAA